MVVIVERVRGGLCVVGLVALVCVEGVVGAMEIAWSEIGWGGTELNRREERGGGETSRAPAEDWGGVGRELQWGGRGRRCGERAPLHVRGGGAVARTSTGADHGRGVHREGFLHGELFGSLLLVALRLGRSGRVDGRGAWPPAALVALSVQVHGPPVALARLLIRDLHKAVME